MEAVQTSAPNEVSAHTLILAAQNAAAGMMANEASKTSIVERLTTDFGMQVDWAENIYYQVKQAFAEAKKSRAKKDILYGALWCIGGTILTIANIGFIFWGAILFGGIQLIKGLVGLASN